MRLIRKPLTLAVGVPALAAVLILSACSSSSTGSAAQSSAPGAASSGASSPAAPAGGTGAKVDLNFWSWAPNVDKVVAMWNAKNPDIQVTVNKQDGGDPAVTKLLTAIKAGSGAPDLMQAEYQKIPTLVSADALTDISKNIDPALKNDFPESVWNSVTLGSQAVYAVPQDSGPMEFYYRADIFAKYGLTPPTTWDEYAAAAEKLHAADPKLYLGTFSASDAGWFTGLTQQAGASWWGIDGDSWSVAIDSAASQKVASYWGGLVAKGVIDNKPMYTPAWNAALNNGTQVGWVSAIWAPSVLVGNAASTAGKWKMAPLPQWDPAKPATGNWGGSATAVTSQSKHVAEAAKFAAWINSDPTATQALASVMGVYPASTSAQKTALTKPPAFFSNQADFYAVASKIAATAAPFTYGPNVNVAFSAYNDQFGKAAQAKSQQGFLTALTAMQAATVADMKNTGFSVK
ncbi:multiple sugar transport system substrate-binding protein [Nakamurella sp. UYEF19]|uniref:extracellular solute-binding protein n=1 Tax=Nakamurella sp. UYEF19 TaxID=1756392 RepID=UPI00339946C8